MDPTPDPRPGPRPYLPYALALGAGSVLAVAGMAHHPTSGSDTFAGWVEETAREAGVGGFVHGALVAVTVVLFFGYTGLSSRLGWHLARVRAAAIAYGFGVVCMLNAALVSGFCVPGLARRYAGEPEEELELLRPALALCHDLNQSMAQAGTIGWSVAVFAWSLVLFALGGGMRAVAVLGLAVGALPALGLLTGHLHLHVHGMGAVVLAQAAWGVCVAVWLGRQR